MTATLVIVFGRTGQVGSELARAVLPAGMRLVSVARDEVDLTAPPSAIAAALDRHAGEAASVVVVNAAAYTAVDRAESEPGACHAVNCDGAAAMAEICAARSLPLVHLSTDYVFDGRKREPYVESDGPHPASAYGRTKLHGEAAAGDQAWIVRSSWLFGPTGRNFVRTMLRLGAERDEVAVVDDQRGSPTFVGHLAVATREVLELPYGIWHVAADGDCTWAGFAEAIFADAGLRCRVRRISTAELGRPAPRPAYSVLRSEKGAPRLPHWREGLGECLARLA